VWYDEAVLKIGDSLRRKIDDGLARCDYGIIIISPSFLNKEWPQRELDGLVALEVQSGKTKILPIWHEIDKETLLRRSPILADRVAGQFEGGHTSTCAEDYHGYPVAESSLEIGAPSTGTKAPSSPELSLMASRGRIVGHSESVAGTASGRGNRLCRGRYSLLSVATNGSPAFALRSWSLISPRLGAADDAFDHREDELNVDDRRFGLS
jgi:hypothetical protein